MRYFATTIIMATLVAMSGCGPDTGGRVGVSGTVTLQGEPLQSGDIQFIAVDGSQMTGASITEGTYTVPAEHGLLPGEFEVRVSSVAEGAGAPAASEEEPPGDPSLVPPAEELIPEEFNARSTLTTEITAEGTNTYDVEIP